MWLTPTLCPLQQGRGTTAPSGPLRGQLWGWGYLGVVEVPGSLMLGDGKPEPLTQILELQPSPNWKSQFL